MAVLNRGSTFPQTRIVVDWNPARGLRRQPLAPFLLFSVQTAATLLAVRSRRRTVAAMSDRVRGVVKWFNNAKGYGFIQPDQGDDVFVHYSDIVMEGYRSLDEGAHVEFTLIRGEKGLRAKEVVRRPSVV